MKKRIAMMCLRVGRFAVREAQKEVSVLLKKHGVKTCDVKKATSKVAKHGMKVAKEMHKITAREVMLAMKTAKKAKKKVKRKVKKKVKKKR
ncbi:hypothetical protein KY304_01830 [Candidatus Woesearchaeota archaeon]|nr:hypothetical protein [Candidatus Woesearchaeota archaeon]